MRWEFVIAVGAMLVSVECVSLGCSSNENNDEPSLPSPIETATGMIDGLVVGSEPIGQATIEVWTVDEQGFRAPLPLYTARSNDQGKFQIPIQDLPLPFSVTARGGVTSEYWSAEALALDDEIHLQAIVTQWETGETRPVVVSPFTTLARALGARRLARRWEPTYAAAVARAQELFDAHVGVALGRVFPAAPIVETDRVLTAEVRHALALAGLSSLARDIAVRSGRSILAINTIIMTRALLEDVWAHRPYLDGMGADGIIELDGCVPACVLSANTLRSELARALVRHYLPSERNAAGLEFGDVAELLYHMAENEDPSLFGSTEHDGIDRSPPVVEMLSSPILDESLDIVSFESSDDGERIVHLHDPAAIIDLSAGAEGRNCPRFSKHSDTLHSAEDNPLRWRFIVRDDLIGTTHSGIEAQLRSGNRPEDPTVPLTVVPIKPWADGGFEYEVTALSSDSDELAAEGGYFQLEIRATDLLGNVSGPFTSCWFHVAMAAPQKVGVLRIVDGPGSFHDINLTNDEIPSLLGGTVAPAQGKILASFDVENPSDDAVYLTLDVEELEGTYESTWIEARAFVREDFVEDQCHVATPPTCSTERPREPPRQRHSGVQPLPLPGRAGFFLGYRAIDKQTGLEDTCAECYPDQMRLAPRRSYEVQVVVTSLDFLLPSSVDERRVSRIMVGPPGGQKQLTGIIDINDYNLCASLDRMDPSRCTNHHFFQLYQALTHARIDIQSLRIQGRTAPAPSPYPRIPRPALAGQSGTFAAPFETSYQWSTEEHESPPQDK